MTAPATIGDVWAIVLGVPSAVVVVLVAAAGVWKWGADRGWWE